MTAKERVALISILTTVLITAAKGVTGWITGSLALQSDAAQSLLDVAATTITYLVVRAADQPPDEEHPYGHAKFESVAALGQTALLCALSGIVAFEGVRRLLANESHVETSIVAFVVLIISIAVDAWRWRALTKTAKATGSEALAADALHFSSDLVNSALVIVALGAAAIGYPQVDAFVAVAVAIFIGAAGWRLGRRTIDSLVDAAPKELSQKIAARAQAIPGVVNVETIKLRKAGPDILGEIGVLVSRTLPLERVSDLKCRIADAIVEESPAAKIVVTANPIALDDESLRERVLVIAARLHLPVHHVTIQHVEERLSISLDLEVDGSMPLGEAHGLASSLEEAIRGELGSGIEVDTHIEPLEISEWAGADTDEETRARMAEALARFAHDTAAIADIHSVRARTTSAGLVVNYHCRVDPALPVAAVHDEVDSIEQKLRHENPDIHRVVGHAEPRRDA
ncbi:cation diffusion facilitator family transporter [Terrarubrum flagellatum]|uniref:cation diffusion facilitator family transporter n=1 Tax=Terrirubrum flagellatum TaxID=2895980 RepID=UPI0031452884